ncbi:plasma membrane protein Pth11-like protein [Xylariaceae sp. FL0662B]|nr:plasma membrane protein Pth11-like protein [Xylariaceae sp. FL0662B]
MSGQYYEKPSHLIAAGVALSVVDIIAVGCRFWLRQQHKLPLKLDDWLMVPATLMTVGIGIVMVYGVSQEALAYEIKVPPNYTGNIFELTTEQIALASKLEYAFSIMLTLALGCIKASILFFYLRIFSVHKGKVHVFLVGFITLIALWTIAFFFIMIFGCKLDSKALWGSTLDLMAQCTKTLGSVIAFCVTDFATDVLVIFVPIPLIWRLKLSTSKKIATSIVFLLAGVTIAASLTRLIITARAVGMRFATGSNEIRIITLYLYWGMVECGIGVLAACLPTLSSLLRGLSWSLIVAKTKSLLTPLCSRSEFANMEEHSIHTSSSADIQHKRDNSISSTMSSS